MATMISELYDALIAAGVSADIAKKAAAAVIAVEDKEQLATKADLHALEVRLMKSIIGAMIAMTGIFAAIVKLF